VTTETATRQLTILVPMRNEAENVEPLLKRPGLVRCEIPFVFVELVTGQSKGTIREGLRYLQLLGEMRWSLWRRLPIQAQQTSKAGSHLTA
jgi:hypothetical protein